MRKTIFELWMLILPVILGLASCTDKEDCSIMITEIDPGSVNQFDPEMLAPMAGLFVAQDVDADLKQAFVWGTNPELSAMNNVETADVYVLNKLTDISEDVLRKCSRKILIRNSFVWSIPSRMSLMLTP
jgi:hypothetical protein